MTRRLKLAFTIEGSCVYNITADHIDVSKSMTIITIIGQDGKWKTINFPEDFIDSYIHSGVIVVRYPKQKTIEVTPIYIP
jgi:hypothetical protein